MKKLEKLLRESNFTPSITGYFFNPFFIIRSALYSSIKELSQDASGSVLDFGCGSKPYRRFFLGAEEYIGCDTSESGHSHTDSDIDVFYDGKKLPFNDCRFDWVVSFETVEHIFNLEEILNELHRVGKHNGFLLISAPFCWDEHEVPYDFARYTSYGLSHLLSQAGFDVIKYVKTGSYILAAFQMLTAYIYQHLFPKSKYLRLLLTPIFIMPIHTLAYILDFLLPRKNEFFLNSVVLCRNVK